MEKKRQTDREARGKRNEEKEKEEAKRE